MAKCIYFKDGTKQVLLKDDKAEFEGIIESKLGRDALELYRDIDEGIVSAEIYQLEQELWESESTETELRNIIRGAYSTAKGLVELLGKKKCSDKEVLDAAKLMLKQLD